MGKLFGLIAAVALGALAGLKKAAKVSTVFNVPGGDQVSSTVNETISGAVNETVQAVTNTVQSANLTIPSFPEAVVSSVEEVSNSVVETVKNTVADVQNVFGTQYDALITSSAIQYGVSPSLLYRLLYAESHFRTDIINGSTRSSTGALGIAQFMPATAIEELGSVQAALNPAFAIPGAARYLAKLYKSTGDWNKAVAAYNWGIGNVKKKGLANAPAETVNYVSQITGANLKEIYG